MIRKPPCKKLQLWNPVDLVQIYFGPPARNGDENGQKGILASPGKWGKALIFFSLPFWKTARKTTKKARISSACRTPKILGKEGKNAQKRKEFLEKEKGKENQKGKEKKIREVAREMGKMAPMVRKWTIFPIFRATFPPFSR